MQIVASIFDFIAYLPVLGTVNRWLGALFGMIENYLIMFILLYILALLPVASIQSLMSKSLLSGLILEHTPIITSMFQNWWYIYMQ